MLVLTEDALLLCEHGGQVHPAVSQAWLTVQTRRVLVADDPERRSISSCVNRIAALGLVPCLLTMTVKQGYSSFIRIDGHQVCLDTVRGLTNGTPPGTVNYTVKNPGQRLVGSQA